MKKRNVILVFTLSVLAFGTPAYAQQKPADPKAEEARRKADAAGQEALLKQAAEQAARVAEATERARLKVADEAAREAKAKASVIIPVDVEIVISRYQADKKVSSLPYALTVNAVDREDAVFTSLRMGGQIPVPLVAIPEGATATGPMQYRDVGTNIDCRVRPLPDGRFEVFVLIDETAIAPTSQTSGQVGGPPVMRTFRSSNTVVLRDGQTRQFTAAADRITGEVVRIDVTLRVAK